MKMACIDLGSNMAQLLVLLEDKNELNYCELTALGESTFKTENLKSQAIDRTLSVLIKYKSILGDHGISPKDVVVYATEACRRAKNRHLLFDKILELEFAIELLSEDREAYLSALGAISSVNERDNTVVLDIGGASTECSLLKSSWSELESFVSLRIGTLSFSEWNEDGILSDRISSFRNEHESKLTFARGKNVICARGAMSTIFNMIKNNAGEQEMDFNGQGVGYEELMLGINSLLKLTKSELIKNFPYVAVRIETLMGALYLSKYILEIIGPERIIISSKGLTHGALIQSKNFSLN